MMSGNLSRKSTHQRECVRCLSNSVCFGRFLEEIGECSVDMSVSHRVVHRNERLYYSGEEFRTLYVLRSGHVKTVMTSEDGGEQITRFFCPGDSLGADGYASGSYPVDAMALDTVGVCAVDIDTLLRKSKHGVETQKLLLKMFSEAIVNAEERVLTRGTLDSEQRMAHFLIGQSKAQARRGCSPTSFTLPMTRADIANYLNLAVETVSRLLTHLKRAGLIKFERNDVEWLDLDGLTNILHPGDVQHRRSADASEKGSTSVPEGRRFIPAHRDLGLRSPGSLSAIATMEPLDVHRNRATA